MARRSRSYSRRKSSSRRYNSGGRRRSGGMRTNRVVLEIQHSAGLGGVGNVFATGNPAQPFAAAPPPATPGKGKF